MFEFVFHKEHRKPDPRDIPTPVVAMGRKKQARPHRSGGISHNFVSSHLNLENGTSAETSYAQNIEEVGFSSESYFVEIDQSYWTTDEHLDIAEILVTDSRAREEFSSHQFIHECYRNPKFSLRFRLRNVDEHECRLKFGHWPVIPAEDIILEFLGTLENKKTEFVIFSGNFDGPGEAVSGLVHLVSQKILMVRPVKEVRVSDDVSSLTMRVEILKNAFNACESLLENNRKLWKKSLMSVMAWLRPEVTTHEAIYGLNKSETTEVDTHTNTGSSSYASRKHTRFNAAGFYDSIKPSKGEPMLDDVHPDLLPELRPYQRRAAYWMVLREKRASESLAEREQNQLCRPFCVPVGFLDTHLNMFYNPFSGNISLLPESSSSYVSGGVLADEMGLGKTVELLACIFTHRKSISEDDITFDNQVQVTRGQMKRLKRERIECICGAVNEIPKYKGLWVQCDICDAWQHADCVGYLPAGKTSDCQEVFKQSSKKISSLKLRSRSRNKNSDSIVEMGENYICQMCLELIQAAKSPVTTGATLIVCPAPILQQWHAEIIRHTKPGSLKTFVYEGVRNASLSVTSTIIVGELVNADIVLTTYEILKEDLSHDTDRHEGDRRFMRFNKRYPVIPTPLTRIFWWRICLDEAQMVESNTAAATEMAMRLHGQHRWCITGTPIQRSLDDLYGLLRFLKASPFDVHRWWVEVIRDPYERKDAGSMKFAHKFFKQIMWRSSKAHVADELQLPPQKESVSWLFFSPIEAHFYQRQHETCLSYAREVIQIYKDEIHKSNQDSESSELSCDLFLTHTEAAKLLHSLLKLRQACCHPQVGSSGLRSMQQSPMSMEEILGVLVCKTKTEGEEALRKLVVALNGLAGIAVIEKDLSRAVSLYREALTLAEEHSDDFRLDPLLNLHICYNLGEILPVTLDSSLERRTMDGKLLENPKEKGLQRYGIYDFDPCSPKRQKISKESSSDVTTDYGNLKHQEKLSLFTSDLSARGLNGDKGTKYDVQPQVSSSSISDSCLRTSCANIKQKYLSVFLSKLSLAQQEFRNSHVQVSNALSNSQNQHISWWMEALHLIEKNKESSDELIRRICEAVPGTLNTSKSSKITSRFRSISGLKYLIQTGLDSLETSRQALLKRLLEIDETMKKPRDEDIVRVRYCRNCQDNSDGPICVLCELDELFQVYEARIFRLTKGGDAGIITSAEEAVALQKKTSALNRFYWALSHPSSASTSTSSPIDSEESKKQREVRAKIVVSRSPSELEIVIGVIRNFSKGRIGRESTSMASKHLLCFEAMRKEYGQARSLATAQAQMLRAHDEIKMATSRLRLTDDKNDAAVDALSSEELTTANVQFSNEKFMFLSLLSRIKGQLRYLQGMVLSRQKTELDRPNSSIHLETTNSSGASHTNQQNECMGKVEDESCPVCHEKLGNQKMVFQCGHVTCCKCLVALTEHRSVPHVKSRDKWVMCPTCRQHTDIANIAYADDRQSKACNSGVQSAFQGHKIIEDSINVRGSYGTKMEAVTRRILWIKSTDPKAKVLVFSSWNDVLDVLEHAFFANEINYIRMKGGRKSHVAIAQFRGQKGNAKLTSEKPGQQLEEKSFQVLLLLIQHGANGLNLLEAQHVILVEPLLNPATEAQAISRVHRIGQDKTTLVHRFIVKDTVEESIYKLGIVRKTSSVISGNTRNQDQPVLTLKDVESLFCSAVPNMPIENESIPAGSLLHLPPAVAASLAAERRWKEGLM